MAYLPYTGISIGDIAKGVADSGNPVKIGGVGSDSFPSVVTAGQRQNLWLGTNGQAIMGTVSAAPADGTSNALCYTVAAGGGTVPLGTMSFVYNGTTWDRMRGNTIGLYTLNAKDRGRTLFSACTVIGGVTTVTTEALLTLTPTRAGVAGTPATAITVTSGKTLRITKITFSSRSTSAAVLSARGALRMNPSGAPTATSPIIDLFSTTQQAAALAEAGDTIVITYPDGLEFTGTQQIGFSQVASAITGSVYVSIVGFEY